jgi:hypothetical protein
MKILRTDIAKVLLWKIQFLLILLTTFILLIIGKVKVDMFLVIVTLVSGFNYLGLLLSKPKTDMIVDGMKQLLTENGSGSPISIEPALDDLNRLMRDAGPLLDQMTKNLNQSKHFRNRQNNNNSKQILT